jgi:glycine C-acetyltransferase
LSSNPAVIQEAKNAIDELGYGIGSAPLMSGTLTVHKELENAISNFYGTENTMLFSSGYAANLGFFQTFLFHYDAIISDQSNHASLIDGIRLARAKRFIFKHNDMQDLERKLIEAQDKRFRVVVTEGIFSMDGDICPLP